MSLVPCVFILNITDVERNCELAVVLYVSPCKRPHFHVSPLDFGLFFFERNGYAKEARLFLKCSYYLNALYMLGTNRRYQYWIDRNGKCICRLFVLVIYSSFHFLFLGSVSRQLISLLSADLALATYCRDDVTGF